MSTESLLLAMAAVAITLIAVIGTICIGMAYWDFRKNLKSLISSTERIARLESDLASIPELVKGLIKVAESLVDNTVSVSKSVDRFHGDLFSPGREGSAFQAYDDRAANAVYERTYKKPDEVNINTPEHFTLGG